MIQLLASFLLNQKFLKLHHKLLFTIFNELMDYPESLDILIEALPIEILYTFDLPENARVLRGQF